MDEKNIMCKDCQKVFTLTHGEVQFFSTKTDDKGEPLVLPKRCPQCRQKKRNQLSSPFRKVATQIKKEWRDPSTY